jgi:hypothetical protein
MKNGREEAVLPSQDSSVIRSCLQKGLTISQDRTGCKGVGIVYCPAGNPGCCLRWLVISLNGLIATTCSSVVRETTS